jgi:hypothetical protein
MCGVAEDWHFLMDRFIAWENIRHYRNMLLSDIAPELRSRVHKLLVEEEDKLAKDLELLADIERHIADGARRIETQQSRVRAMQADGHDGVGRAQAFLDGLMESQGLSMRYRKLIANEIGRNRLLGI